MGIKKYMASVIILITLLFSGSVFINAEENGGGVSDWTLSNLEMEHLGVSFELRGVTSAQEATAVISTQADASEEEVEIMIPFTVESGTQTYELSLPEGNFLLEDVRYCLTIMDQNGESISSYAYVKCNISAEIYFEYTQVEIDYVSKYRIVKAVAEVDSEKYEGEIEDGVIMISYPKPVYNKSVHVELTDEYGCVKQYTGNAESPHGYNMMTFYTLPDSVRFQPYAGILKFASDERLAVQIGEEMYYTEYGYTLKSIRDIGKVEYPIQQPGTRITVWMEKKSGQITNKRKYTVSACSFYDGIVSAYPEMLSGLASEGFLGQMPTKARVRIGEEEYETGIGADGGYTIFYPEQLKDTELTLELLDDHGCCMTKTVCVKNEFVTADLYECNNENNIWKITPTKVRADYLTNTRICVQIGSNVYKSSSEISYDYYGRPCLEVTYPVQKYGTKIIIWYEDVNTSKATKWTTTITQKIPIFSFDEFTADYMAVEPRFYFADYPYATHDIKEICVYINGKKYQGKRSEDIIEDYFVMKYSAKVGDTARIVVTDTEGETYEAIYRIPNVKPDIKIKRIDSGSGKITGKTEDEAVVTVQIGKKEYWTTSGKWGDFCVRINPQKTGTKVTVSVKTKEGYYGSKTTKVKKARGDISFSKNIYRNNKKISCRVTNAMKGDFILLQTGKKTYKRTLDSEKKNQTITFSVRKSKAGTKVKVTYYDRYGKKKSSDSTTVFYRKFFRVGMSSKNALLTTWGQPAYKNDYGYFQQWVFFSPKTIVYVYLQNGKVTAVQQVKI